MFRLDVSISLMCESSRTQDRPPKNKISKLPSLSHILFLHPPPSFHFSMIRGENFANSIANRMSGQSTSAQLGLEGTLPTIYF